MERRRFAKVEEGAMRILSFLIALVVGTALLVGGLFALKNLALASFLIKKYTGQIVREVVIQDVRGTGKSEGEWAPFPHEEQDWLGHDRMTRVNLWG